MARYQPVSLEESPEDPHPEDPQGPLARPGVLGALPLAEAGEAALFPGLVIHTGAGPAETIWSGGLIIIIKTIYPKTCHHSVSN